MIHLINRLQIYGPYFSGVMGKEGFSVYPVVMRPKSRGTVRLASANYKKAPVVDPNYLNHPDDLKLLIKGMRGCRI